MEYTIHRISLDIHSVKSQATLRVKQADTSRKLRVTLCEGGLPYHIASDCYANFSAHKPDGTYIHNVCQIVNNTIEYTFTEQTTAAMGEVDCEITLYDNNGHRITSPHFTIIVDERVYNGEEIVSSPEANVLDDLINRAEIAVDNAESFVDSNTQYVGDNFANAFKGYAEGTIVQVNDVSPVGHIVGCKVRGEGVDLSTVKVTRCGRNLIPAYKDLSTKTVNGVTFTVNADKSITCNGTATDNAVFRLTTDYKLPSGVYTLLGCPSSGSGNARLQTNKLIDGAAKTGAIDLGGGGVLSVDGEYYVYTYVVVLSGQTVSNITFKPMMLLASDTDTTYEAPFYDTYSVNADGTVDGMTSLSPSMTIFTDAANTTISCEYNKDSNKVVQSLYNYITGETMPPVSKISSVKLLASKWVGDASPYSQVVQLSGITENSMVDLTPSVEQLSVFYNKDLAFVTENVGGVVTVYAIGQKPTNDYTIQVAITEVDV